MGMVEEEVLLVWGASQRYGLVFWGKLVAGHWVWGRVPYFVVEDGAGAQCECNTNYGDCVCGLRL